MSPVKRIADRTLGGVFRTAVVALEKLVELPRNIKQALLLSLDMVFVNATMWGAIALRHGHTNFPIGPIEIACAVVTTVVSAVIFLRLGLYRAVIRFMGQQALWAIIRGVSYSSLVLGATVFFTRATVPRSLPFLYWVLALVAIGGTRLLVRAYYQGKLYSSCEKVIIYGAGESGRQLLTAINNGDQFRAVYFVDDSRLVETQPFVDCADGWG